MCFPSRLIIVGIICIAIIHWCARPQLMICVICSVIILPSFTQEPYLRPLPAALYLTPGIACWQTQANKVKDTIFLHSQWVKVKLERKREVLYQGWRCKEGWRCGLGTSRATASKSDYHPLLFVNINIIFSFPNLCTCTLHFAWDITWPSLVLASTYGLVVLGSNITRGAGKYCEWAKHSRSCQLISACLLPKPIQLLPSSLSLSTVLNSTLKRSCLVSSYQKRSGQFPDNSREEKWS